MINENNLPETLQEAIVYFSDDTVCLNFVASLRWADGIPTCPRCSCEQTSFLKTRLIWKCKGCKKQFSVKFNTIFEDSPLGLDKWLTAMWLIANAKNGISSYELHRAIGITQKSAWFVLHRIRLAMQAGTFEKLSGIIEVDETYFGGKAKNMHASRRKAVNMKSGKGSKTGVMGMVQRKGRVRAKVINTADRDTLQNEIKAHVVIGSEIYTDDHKGYDGLYEAYLHDVVNHSIEYVRGNVHTNSIENFWSLLKRTVKGTYISVAPEHLQKYVEEQAFRYNEREGNDQDRFLGVIKAISGKRLTYNQLIGLQSEGF